MGSPRRHQTSDIELLDRAASGDSRAFSALYARHADYVFALISRLVGPVAEREDLLQESFLKFHAALQGYRGESSVRTFAARIAVNCALDHLRRRRRRPVAVSLADVEPVGVGGDPLAHSECVEVLAGLERLKPELRVALVLRAALELSYPEIAELTGCKPDAARQRVKTARRKLERLLSRGRHA